MSHVPKYLLSVKNPSPQPFEHRFLSLMRRPSYAWKGRGEGVGQEKPSLVMFGWSSAKTCDRQFIKTLIFHSCSNLWIPIAGKWCPHGSNIDCFASLNTRFTPVVSGVLGAALRNWGNEIDATILGGSTRTIAILSKKISDSPLNLEVAYFEIKPCWV